MSGIETTLKAVRKDGLVEFRREIHGISRIVTTAPSSDLCLKALQPHFKSESGLNSVSLGIEVEIGENLSFAQPISQSSIDPRQLSIDVHASAEQLSSSFNHPAVFVKDIVKHGPCHYQDIEIGDEIWSVDGTMIRCAGGSGGPREARGARCGGGGEWRRRGNDGASRNFPPLLSRALRKNT